MRQFSDDDLLCAERRAREVEPHVVRQKVVVARFEVLGDTAEAQHARLYLALQEQRLKVARKALQQIRVQRARASFRAIGK